MPDQHPITPPPEMLQQWTTEYWGNPGERIGEGEKYIAIQAARWGADKELEACCEYLTRCAAWEPEDVQEMRDLRRPKPKSLAEVALEEVGVFEGMGTCNIDIIRRALERLQELEGQA